MQFWSILEQKSLLVLRAEGRAPGLVRRALMTPGRFLPPNTFLMDKLPWFPMVLVAVGG